MLSLRCRPQGREQEEGQALLIVLACVALLTTIPLAIVTTTVGQLPLTTSHVLWNAAYEAGQAGLNDYLQHLDASESYTACNSTNNGVSPCPSNPALAGWEQVDGTSNPVLCYEYSPTIREGDEAGLVSVTVSGKAVDGGSQAIPCRQSGVVRNFLYTVRPQSSLDTIYWSEYETTPGNASCDVWQGVGGYNGYTSGCAVSFTTNDVLDGPVFSDDAFYICGAPTFLNTVTSADAAMDSISPGFRYSSNCNGTTDQQAESDFHEPAPQNPTSNPNGDPVFHGTFQAAQTSDASDLAAAEKYGCYINATSPTVPVVFTLQGTKLTWSGGTLANSAGNPNSSASCGGGGASSTFDSLEAALFYVSGQLTVSGTVQGDLDLVSSDTIFIDGSITYPEADITNYGNELGLPWSDNVDSLGLIATNFVKVSHAGNSTQCTGAHPAIDSCDYVEGNKNDSCAGVTPSTSCALEIDAAMLALTGSVEVDNYASGPIEGSLRVFGSIAQYNRGPVGTVNNSGYLKDYHYDDALKFLWPPYFLPPNGAVWSPAGTAATPAYSELNSGSREEALPGT